MEKSLDVERIGRDTPCCRCGYNLRGLGVEGRCPECGEAVEVSRAGRHLAASDPRWRWRLRVGAGLHASGLIGFLVILTDLLYDHSTGIALIRMLYMLMGVAVSLGVVGAWLTTSSEPGGPYFDNARWLRRLVRGLTVLSWSGMVGYTAIQMDWIDFRRSPDQMVLWRFIAGIMAFGGSLLVTGLAIWYLSDLGKRLGPSRLVFCGRLSAFSSAITVATYAGLAYVVRGSSLFWLGVTLHAVLFLWPAAYQLVWRRRVGLLSRRSS